MANTVITFHVTDLEALERLVQLDIGSSYGLLNAMGLLLRALTIILILLLSFFKAVSSDATKTRPPGNA